MLLLIRPRRGFPDTPPSRASSQRARLEARLESRRAVLDSFWQQIVAELRIPDAQRITAEKRSLRKLAGVGMLVVDDSIVNFDRLKRLDWLLVWRERRLPTPCVPMSSPGPPPPPPPAAAAWPFWHLNTIHKNPAGPTGNGVTVGVIDNGYDPAYPDLGAFAPVHAKYVGPTSSAADGMVVGLPPSDPPGSNHHGSMVCVMLAGGTCGVASGAAVRVASITPWSYNGAQIQMASALDWLMTHPSNAHTDRPFGCDIITTSIHTNNYAVNDVGSEVQIMLDEAEGWDTLVIAAVGNGGANNWQAPGCYPTVLAVGSVDEGKNVAWFSAYGNPSPLINKPDLLAPGVDLLWPDGAGSTTVSEGTSFSAPIVAGAAALILEAQPQHRDSVVKFRSAVTSFTSASTSPGTLQSGRGVIDLTGL